MPNRWAERLSGCHTGHGGGADRMPPWYPRGGCLDDGMRWLRTRVGCPNGERGGASACRWVHYVGRLSGCKSVRVCGRCACPDACLSGLAMWPGCRDATPVRAGDVARLLGCPRCAPCPVARLSGCHAGPGGRNCAVGLTARGAGRSGRSCAAVAGILGCRELGVAGGARMAGCAERRGGGGRRAGGMAGNAHRGAGSPPGMKGCGEERFAGAEAAVRMGGCREARDASTGASVGL